MFWVAHLDHGITITHLPFQMSASIALGLLAYLTRSLVPAMIAHGAADLLLQPVYLFRHPEFVWKALTARPVWEGIASTFPEKLLTIGRALSPKHLFAGDPFQLFAIIAWDSDDKCGAHRIRLPQAGKGNAFQAHCNALTCNTGMLTRLACLLFFAGPSQRWKWSRGQSDCGF